MLRKSILIMNNTDNELSILNSKDVIVINKLISKGLISKNYTIEELRNLDNGINVRSFSEMYISEQSFIHNILELLCKINPLVNIISTSDDNDISNHEFYHHIIDVIKCSDDIISTYFYLTTKKKPWLNLDFSLYDLNEELRKYQKKPMAVRYQKLNNLYDYIVSNNDVFLIENSNCNSSYYLAERVSKAREIIYRLTTNIIEKEILKNREPLGEKTLEEIGDMYSVTRERIRQIEKKIKLKVLGLTKINTFITKEMVIPLFINEVNERDKIAELFGVDNYHKVCKYFEQLYDLKDEKITSHLYTWKQTRSTLKKLMIDLPNPVSEEQLYSKFMNMNCMGIFDEFIQSLKKSSDLVIEVDKGIYHILLEYPINIIIAKTFFNFPNGLHWEEAVSKAIKEYGASKANYACIQWNKDLYIYGEGIYRHIKYYSLTELDEITICEIFNKELELNNIINIQTFWKTSKDLSKYNYYDIRYLCERKYKTVLRQGIELIVKTDITIPTKYDIIIKSLMKLPVNFTKDDFIEFFGYSNPAAASKYLSKLCNDNILKKNSKDTFVVIENQLSLFQ